LELTSLRQVQALAHPLRFRAFERLIDRPRTGKQLALALGKQPTRLYHHLAVLERAGLVRQVATRKKRGTTERYYRAVADRVVVDRQLFGRKVAAGRALFAQVMRLTLDELADADTVADNLSPRPPILLKRLRIRTSAGRIAALHRGLEAWLRRFASADAAEGDGEFAVTVAFYPVDAGRPA
jgi:DNA-binding transcriptional ArsR family regulator